MKRNIPLSWRRSPPTLRPILTPLAILTLTAVVWSLLEGTITLGSFFRHVVWADDRPGSLGNQPLFQWDRGLGWVPRAGLRELNGMGPGKSVTTDARGFRLSPYATLSEGTRILCSGDSFTFGEQVGDDSPWCARLSREPGIRSVTNLGVSGYGLDQSYLRYHQWKHTLPHDVHILALILDDLTRMKSQQSPFGPLKPILTVHGNGKAARLERVTTWLDTPMGMQWFLRRVHLAERLPSVRLLRGGFSNPYGASAREWDELMELSRQILRELAAARPLLVLIFPTRHDVFHRNRSPERERILTLLQEERIRYLDFFERMENLPLEQVRPLFLADGHFSAKGHAFVADETASVLKGMSLGNLASH